jgi:hypothetical protein
MEELPLSSIMILVIFVSMYLTNLLFRIPVFLHIMFQCFVGAMFIVLLSVYRALKMKNFREENVQYLKRIKQYTARSNKC